MQAPHTKLEVWQAAMAIAEAVYRLSTGFPADERFGLTAQIRRAVVSIPCNIAEGHGRGGTQEFLHFLGIARGSLREVETQLDLARRLGFAAADIADPVASDLSSLARQLTALIAATRPETRNGTAPGRPRNAGAAGPKPAPRETP